MSNQVNQPNRGPVVGLPTLVGSERQVAWAAPIRERSIRRAMLTMCHVPEAARAKACDIVEAVLNQASAGWWIEHRDDDFSAVALLGGAQ